MPPTPPLSQSPLFGLLRLQLTMVHSYPARQNGHIPPRTLRADAPRTNIPADYASEAVIKEESRVYLTVLPRRRRACDGVGRLYRRDEGWLLASRGRGRLSGAPASTVMSAMIITAPKSTSILEVISTRPANICNQALNVLDEVVCSCHDSERRLR